MECWFCGAEVFWNGDFTFEDYCLEGEGIVANLSCSKCNAYYEAYSGEEQE